MRTKIFLLFTLIMSCNSDELIKNDDTQLTEEIALDERIGKETTPILNADNTINGDIIGYWVGFFVNNSDINEKVIAADEGLYWTRENKINISIDSILNQAVYGHSVVAGNSRPFIGEITTENDIYYFNVKEPGDDKYDGAFTFQIPKTLSKLSGTWLAYKDIDIPKRKYNLEKANFIYNPNQMLLQKKPYGNWLKYKEVKVKDPALASEIGDFVKEFESSTEKIYEINASTKVLTKTVVENLTKGDLLIIRNAIYARHGYSFKNRPLRVFFDQQEWYIPVHANIKSEFTPIEKENIKLLMRYEKNAKTYYDYFGRG